MTRKKKFVGRIDIVVDYAKSIQELANEVPNVGVVIEKDLPFISFPTDDLIIRSLFLKDYRRRHKSKLTAYNFQKEFDRFLKDGRKTAKIKVVLIFQEKAEDVEKIKDKMDKKGLRPATLREFINFMTQGPEELKKYLFVALGTERFLAGYYQVVWARKRIIGFLWKQAINLMDDVYFVAVPKEELFP